MNKVLLIILGIGAVALGIVWWLVISEDNVSQTENRRDVSEEGVSEDFVGAEVAEVRTFELVSEKVVLGDSIEANFRLPSVFDIEIAAEDLGRARFMAMSSDGRVFVPDLVNYSLSHEGRVIILGDFNEETHRFETRSTYLSGLRGPNSVAFYTDQDGNEWFYIALTDRLVRYSYRAGDLRPSSEPELIATFPDWQSPGETSVVWHITRTILFHDDTLYVSVGSGCNACEQPETEMRGAILAMDPKGENVRIYADGLRNAVGIEWAGDALYATENGVDHLGSAAPDDVMYQINPGEHYGWPYCYELNGVNYEDESRSWERKTDVCENAPLSFAAFGPHTAPLGLTFFEEAHPVLKDSFLVALHGSFEPEIGRGYQVVRVSKGGEKDIFMDGFLSEDGERFGRPVHFLQRDENSFFMTDDHKGRIYYIYARE